MQIRIDTKTKKEAKKVFEAFGLDLSTAVKMMLKQAIFTKRIPFEIKDENGFSVKFRDELDKAIKDAESSSESYQSTEELFKALAR
ncbi:MAG: Addiction module antitoxin, RelB/DinJ family [Candidatus Falkowbacteria bacterium GW2011_GWD2_38_42]|uniref:Addiction module antitoxin, RelB/DinJ family n=1 Tax=Candidatus Falkowbacteria bacterium GW2011_GWE1_38_31 TaxID=1618638 RepID=A0A0G0MYI4_9BACT|nr:MAG: Addiction module antitoxin, RelB/DinJ family [Candidatus Falkowbacteria bacterium GW2011_GWF1_38_22]KKQ65394.1 MAG: Addiction module antitoxin, RelB/DinJ family [Candidatus Falkowbacteria bacterium GW2011_GWE2_38_254]KKQ69971.1 MAG: Addiction module antitoxin, RelB/DinJ family [Candidatus Falkowbacteria bacterium GW2011_GWE1_38_31]KKQ72535.1 MAG: Addiction module antitoxin, RelB/DinJ family [Candidatus Falkowbacteria bacterium GW2011_GWD2_38_42]